MTHAQIFGLIMATLMLAAAVYGFRGARALLTDGRERRRYRAFVDEDRARETRLRDEVHELEVRHAMSGLDDELTKLLDRP